MPEPLRWVERFHIYVLSVGNLAAGASVEDLPLPFDTDAPFELRGRGGRVQNDPRFGQAGMNGLLTTYRDARGRYVNDALVPWPLDVPGNGLGGAWKPVYPGRHYPVRSALPTTISNTGPGALDLVNLQLYYVGVKKYPPTRPWRSFPEKCSPLPFKYTYWSLSPGKLNLPFQHALMPPDTNGMWDNIPLTIENDADFCMLGGQCGIFGVQPGPYFYQELFITLKDQAKQPYMSAPVHVDWLFGSPHQSAVATAGDFYLPNNSLSIYGSANPADSPFAPNLMSAGFIPGQTPLVGPWHPGLFYPQIYIPANQQHYFDLMRNDGQYTLAYAAPDDSDPATIVPPSINFHITFEGLKVFHRR